MEYRDRTDVFDPESYDGWEPVLLEERVENPPDHRTPEYFTPEYEHARPIPSIEVEQLLRRNLIFQPLDDERGVYAIQRGRVAMKTVLDRADRPLRHKTLTPYELFRALNNGDNKNWGKDLFDLDLVVLRLNGDDPLRKKNGQPIDYWMQIEMLVASRSLPTWIMTVWHYGVHQFRAAYSRGSRDLSKSLETNFQDVRFGEVRAPAGSLNRNELLINPRTGESRMPASGLLSPPIRCFQLSEESTQAANHEGTSQGRHSGFDCEDDTSDDPVTREYLASGGVLLRKAEVEDYDPNGCDARGYNAENEDQEESCPEYEDSDLEDRDRDTREDAPPEKRTVFRRPTWPEIAESLEREYEQNVQRRLAAEQREREAATPASG